jgi:proteasome lid subunit RPN8/RPN11
VTLYLTSEHLHQLQTHAEQTYPEECCGLLMGQFGDENHSPDFVLNKTLIEVWPTDNTWSAALETKLALAPNPCESSSLTRTRRYAIDPQILLRAQREGRDRQLEIIGIYHSHPDHPAIPSECDRTLAWPQYSYIIVAVHQGKAQDLQSWSLDDDDRFQPEEISVRALAKSLSPRVAPQSPTPLASS